MTNVTDCIIIQVYLEEGPDWLGGGVDVGVQVSVSVRPGDQGQVAGRDSVPVVVKTGSEKCF